METYKKYITEAKKKQIILDYTKFKYMGKANDSMADFLEELEDKIPAGSNSKDNMTKKLNRKLLIKQFRKIEDDWDKLWTNIVILSRGL